ncbi:MAG TPA: CsgG/HfaB family protein, partial [candidate division Zixibacteria bacterium]|nr:CsgG/HfaB family protein [candidate division Zixibacteria bacterium]
PDLSDADAKAVYLLLAKASAGKEFVEQAEEYLRKVIEIDPKFTLNTQLEPPQVQRIWYKVDEERRAGGRPDPGIKTLAVLYFENASAVDHDALQPLTKGLAAMLITDLTGLTGLQVVERERIQYILDEIKMEQTAYFKEETAVRVGKILGAHAFLMGSYAKLDAKTLRIDARLVKTETGELIKAEKVTGDPKSFAELQAELALKIAEGLKVAVKDSEEKAIRAAGRLPIAAVLAYTRGLNYEDEQNLTSAYKAYQEALAEYPEHEAARDRLTALEPIVAASGG